MIMKIRKMSKIIISLVMASVVLSACSTKQPKNIKENQGDAKVKHKSNINVMIEAEPRTLDQAKTIDTYSSDILTNVMEGLTRIEIDENGNDEIKAAGAESWNVSEGGKVWTFKLRDMMWSDGKKVIPEDYIYGITRMLSPEIASDYAFLLFPIKNAEQFNSGQARAEDLGIKKISENELQFTLEQPTAYFLKLTYFRSMNPQRKDIVEKEGDMYGSNANNMVYTGPFVISKWVRNSTIELVKNENYWDKESVKIDKITMKHFENENDKLNAFLDGSIDIGEFYNNTFRNTLDENKEFIKKEKYEGSTSYTLFNQHDKYFKNENIRKAFIIASGREQMPKEMSSNLGKPATGWCPPGVKVILNDYRDKVEYSPVENLKNSYGDPKELLEVGLKQLGLDETPSNHTFKYLQAEGSERTKQYAEHERNVIEKTLGVNIEVEYVDWNTFQQRTRQMKYQMACQSWTGDYDDPSTFFDIWVSTSGIVPTGWSNAKYDELIKNANRSIDEDERTELFKQAEKILIEEDGVISPLIWSKKSTYIRKNIKGFMKPMWGNMDFKYVYKE
ncbi:peptide ABC transporter substrate-binding protein [Clostridium ihumii]|uniref:peptide ABC transporter substrate-binding protein n=1 Tax=Clostridium ihumii TaxID=1470356 RepID=UPI000AD7D852|nr:peptide ABC transporter substrate-binding protein [Clostridium ihumii]